MWKEVLQSGIVSTQLTGSIPAGNNVIGKTLQGQSYSITTLLNAVTVAPSGAVTADYSAQNADQVFILIGIDKQPWYCNHTIGPWNAKTVRGTYALYPEQNGVTSTSTITSPVCLIPINASTGAGVFPATQPTDFTKALERRQINEDAQIGIGNQHATDNATVTVKILRIWGG